jgi:2-C-methyl-D-erythritol 4-phosphate cytidylyltransferase
MIEDTMCMVIVPAARPVAERRTVAAVMQAAAAVTAAAASVEPHNRFKNQH